MPVVRLEGAGLLLRPFEDRDAPALVDYFADPAARRWTAYDAPGPYTLETACWWMSTHADRFAGGGAVLAVVEADLLVGWIELHGLPPNPVGTGSIGYCTVPAARRRGVATRALLVLCRWAYGQGFARLELTTHPENSASQRVALAAGFRREALLRRSLAGPQGREDRVLYARLAEDPDVPTPRALPDLREPLTDGVVNVRPQRPDDAPMLVAAAADPDYQRWLPASVAAAQRPTAGSVRARLARVDDHWLAGSQAACTVLAVATGEPVGTVSLRMTEPELGTAQLGWSTAPAHRGRGYAPRGARLLARWAFDVVGISRIEAPAGVDNHASRVVGARAGFREEGVLRSAMAGPDGRYDLVMLALIRDDLTGAAPGTR